MDALNFDYEIQDEKLNRHYTNALQKSFNYRHSEISDEYLLIGNALANACALAWDLVLMKLREKLSTKNTTDSNNSIRVHAFYIKYHYENNTGKYSKIDVSIIFYVNIGKYIQEMRCPIELPILKENNYELLLGLIRNNTFNPKILNTEFAFEWEPDTISELILDQMKMLAKTVHINCK